MCRLPSAFLYLYVTLLFALHPTKRENAVFASVEKRVFDGCKLEKVKSEPEPPPESLSTSFFFCNSRLTYDKKLGDALVADTA